MVLMGNSIIEGPIPLGGSGFIAKENGNFLPGEYKRLSNLEIDSSGFLINRRNVYSVHGENTGAAVVPIQNPQRFLGNMGSYSIISKGDTQFIAGESTFLELWRLSEGGGPAGPISYSQFLGFFRYNNRNYWLVFEFNSAISVSLVLYYDVDIPVPDIPETYAPGYGASLTREVLLTFASDTTDFYEFQFRNFFIYKERLWIATTVGLYFSAATDPTEFAVADGGGFFKHPGNRVNYAFAIKDNVYTLCDDAVYAMTYSTDPNVDSSERPLSDTIGGEMGCVHLDTPYFINNLGIFVINGNNIDKVMDSRFDYGKDAYSNHIYSFEEYLVVNKYSPVNYDNNYSPPAKVTIRKNLWQSPESDAVGGTQIINGWTVSGSPAVQTRTNLVVNPNVNIDPNNALADYFTDTFFGDYVMGHSAGIVYLGPNAGFLERTDSVGSKDIAVHTWVMPADELTDYAFSTYVRPNVTRQVQLKIYYKNIANEDISNVTKTIDATGAEWTRISRVVNTPENTAYVFFQIIFKAVAGTANQYWDASLVEKSSTVNSYFDGDFADDTFKTYAWTGVAHESTSTLTVQTCVMDAVAAVADGISAGKVLRWGGTFADPNDLGGLAGPDGVWGKATYTFDPTSAFVSGIPYTFRFDHKGNGSWINAKLEFKLEYLDIADAVIGSSNHTVSLEYNPSAAYQTFLVDNVMFPLGTEKMRVTYTFTLDVTGQVGTTAWSIDLNKFQVEKTSTYSGYFTGATADTADVTYSWVGVAFASESTTGGAATHSYLRNNGSKFEPFQQGNTLGYNTYFINTENGAAHVLDFVDQYESFSHGEAGFIVDAIVNPFSNASGNYKILFLTNKAISESPDGHVFKGNVYYVSSSEDIEVNDYAVNNLNVLRRRAPKIDMEIDSFVPDGLEYRLKKFRSLLLQGIMPPSGMQLDVAYDNFPVTQEVELGDNEAVLSNPRRHYAHRIGLNQRGRSITLRLRNLLWPDEILAPFGDLEISDMRVMWTYTQRLPSTRRIGS